MLNNPPQYLDDDSEPLKFDPNFPNCYKMYVTTALLDNDPDKECLFSNQFLKVVERFANVICLNVTLPETDIGEWLNVTNNVVICVEISPRSISLY